MEKEYVALSRAHGALNGGPANQVSQLIVNKKYSAAIRTRPQSK